MKSSNSLKYNVQITKGKVQYEINIRLNDECKNGHQDFSITGSMWEAGKARIDKNMISCGAIGDTIAKNFPEFAIFNELHLCDYKGNPMYADSNGFYHIKNGFDRLEMGETQKDAFCRYYSVTPKQYDVLLSSEDQGVYKYHLYTLGIVEAWGVKAAKAISQLEELTNTKFIEDSTRLQLLPLTEEERVLYSDRLKNGYYTPEKIQERETHKIQKANEELKNKLIKEAKEKNQQINDELTVKLYLIELGASLSNFIFYNHTNTGVFNWKSYEKQMSIEEFDSLQKQINPKKLPNGVKFELK